MQKTLVIVFKFPIEFKQSLQSVDPLGKIRKIAKKSSVNQIGGSHVNHRFLLSILLIAFFQQSDFRFRRIEELDTREKVLILLAPIQVPGLSFLFQIRKKNLEKQTNSHQCKQAIRVSQLKQSSAVEGRWVLSLLAV